MLLAELKALQSLRVTINKPCEGHATCTISRVGHS
jgi:hypothetical protein